MGLADHQLEHKYFTRKVADFQSGFETGKLGVDIEILNFLTKRLIDHIFKQDQLISRHLPC